MAAHTTAESELRYRSVRIVGVRFARAVTGFASDGFMLKLGHLLVLLGMALIAGFLAGMDGFTRGNFRQGITAKPAILCKRWRSEKKSRGTIDGDDADGEQDKTDNLGRHFKEEAHRGFRFPFGSLQFSDYLLSQLQSSRSESMRPNPSLLHRNWRLLLIFWRGDNLKWIVCPCVVEVRGQPGSENEANCAVTM